MLDEADHSESQAEPRAPQAEPQPLESEEAAEVVPVEEADGVEEPSGAEDRPEEVEERSEKDEEILEAVEAKIPEPVEVIETIDVPELLVAKEDVPEEGLATFRFAQTCNIL